MTLLGGLIRIHHALGVALLGACGRGRNQVLFLGCGLAGGAGHGRGGSLNLGGLQVQGGLRGAGEHAQGARAHRQVLGRFLETDLLLQGLVLLHETLFLRAQVHHVVLSGHD